MIAMIAAVAMLGSSFYDFKVRSIDGETVSLGKYRGKVVLVVNVASQCGLTRQYAALESLYRAHKEDGLVVLGFPSNDFGGQEPGTEAEIKQFCSSKYDVTFPMFAKVKVTGEDKAPLYDWLLTNSPVEGEIEWNFAKFIIGRNGTVAARFSPRTTPEDEAFVAAIEAELKKKG
jgi:glutathione peroxidase